MNFSFWNTEFFTELTDMIMFLECWNLYSHICSSSLFTDIIKASSVVILTDILMPKLQKFRFQLKYSPFSELWLTFLGIVVRETSIEEHDHSKTL